MKARRRLVLIATAMSVAFFASGLPSSVAHAAPPPTTNPAAVESGAPNDTAPPDQEVQSWALVPANDLPDKGGSRSTLTYVADQGAVIQDAVTLLNYGTDAQTFRVFATDAFNNADGQFDVLASDQVPADVGTWVTFPQEMVTVPAGKQVTIPISITIPAGASAGDHVGAILASSPSVGAGGNGQVITVDRRTGSRLYLRVNGPLFPELAVADVETSYHQSANPLDGSAHVTYRIENRGNVRLGGGATLTIGGPLGLGNQTVTLPDIPELLPGQDVVLSADVDGVPAAFLDRTTIRVRPTGSADLGTVRESAGSDLTFAPPLAVLGFLLALLFGLLAFRAYRRRVLGESPASTGVEPLPELEREHQPS